MLAVTFATQLQIDKKGDQHAFGIYRASATSPPALRSLDQGPTISLVVRQISVVSARYRIQKLRKCQLAQTHSHERSLINRKAFVEPVVITFERQSIWHPEMKQLVRQGRAQLCQRSSL